MRRMLAPFLLFGLTLLLLAGCGSRFGMGAAEPTPTAVAVPTFTPTPETAQGVDPVVVVLDETATPTAEPAEETAAETVEEVILLPTPTPVADSPPAAADVTEAAPTAAPADEPALIVSGEAVNVRGGPSIDYAIVGAAVLGDQFALTGRNEAGDWWQVCCFDEQPGWLYAPLVELRNEGGVALTADIPALPQVEAEPVAEPVAEAEDTPVDGPAAEEAPAAEPAPAEAAPAEPVSTAHSGTAGNFDPNAQYQIVNYRVIGYGENNGGIFDNGGQHMIFVNVIDAAGNGIDGAVVKDAVDDKLNVVTGSKGPGRAEFEMFWERYKLYIASDPSGPVTSQISNQMNTAYPHVPDIIGKLGPVEEEYAICPTPDDRCEPPFYHAHWSYEITFQKVN